MSERSTRAWTHEEFRKACAEGAVRVDIDPVRAARFVSARLLLPLVAMPVLGIGIALALLGWVKTGLATIAIGIVVPRLIKRGAARFVAHQALVDEALYRDAVREEVLRITPVARA
jgi:hypothetical protein